MPVARRALVLSVVASLAVGGCGIRLETPPPDLPSAGTAEQTRSGAVTQALDLATSADQLAAAGGSEQLVGLLQQIAAGSARHVESLGGVWVPPVRPTPSDAPPDPTTSAIPAADAAALLTQLLEGAATARADSATAEADLGRVLVSVALWRSLAAHELAAAIQVDGGVLPEGLVLPTGRVDAVGLQVASLTDPAALVRGLDAAAYGYEVLAARSEDPALVTDWLARVARLRTTAETLARSAGIADTAADPREAVYDVDALIALDPAAAATSLEITLATLWSNLTVPAALRPALVDAALECYLRAMRGASLAALDSPAAVLPGLTVTS